MVKLFTIAVAALVLTVAPVAILRLPGENGLLGWCKYAGSVLLVPGTLISFFVSGQRVDDVSHSVAMIANFCFYGLFFYACAFAWSKYRNRIARR